MIYPAAKREVTFKLTNNATTPRLIQAWIDRGDATVPDHASDAPFVVMPPIFRIDPDKAQTLRIMFPGGDVPQDRESVFWLNILELQPTPAGKKTGEENVVQFSIRTRLKLFYRPENLPGKPEEAVSQLRWRVVQAGKEQYLECGNPSAFSVSFHDVQFKSSTNNNAEPLHGMCPAKDTAQFPLSNSNLPEVGKIKITAINDFGGFDEHDAQYGQ
ncbi:molecular chaperone [Citrobacter sp. BDA59-3]|uniref:fimbrial biogenesis chaperone n=1 Tax=Citrobacter sp. BDA59-3 TaxID=2781952 RepID=UPI001881E98D|nr:fimbria/pilus periplasmic chaperone [Citrobacter sp. BDA59-3]QOV69672.1 fimbria/pilus periplasmic chaperone [Citrobacter sp. BDA59-3]